MKIVPNFSFETAPAPKIIVIPAQDEPSEATQSTDVTMSVCTGAFVLAKTGLLSGKPATTHHNAYADLAMQFPDIQVKRGARFVEAGNLASAGGPVQRHRSGAARGGALFRSRSRRANRLLHGISG